MFSISSVTQDCYPFSFLWRKPDSPPITCVIKVGQGRRLHPRGNRQIDGSQPQIQERSVSSFIVQCLRSAVMRFKSWGSVPGERGAVAPPRNCVFSRLFLISINGYDLEFSGSAKSCSAGQCALTPPPRGSKSTADELPALPAFMRATSPTPSLKIFHEKNFHEGGGETECGKGKAELSAVDFEGGGVALGIPAEPGFTQVLRTLGKSPADLFPINRVTTRCSKCSKPIARGEGYRHNRVGEKKVYCTDCHSKMGLPLRV